MDGRDQRPEAIGPVRAYGRGYRERCRSPDFAARRNADAGTRSVVPSRGLRGSFSPEAARGLTTKIGRSRLRCRSDPLVLNRRSGRSEEHTSELQSLMRISYAVFCLKNKTQLNNNTE